MTCTLTPRPRAQQPSRPFACGTMCCGMRSSPRPRRGGTSSDAAHDAGTRVQALGRGRHPARADRLERLQELHLFDALPEAALRPLRRGGRARRSRRPHPQCRGARPGRARVLRAARGALGRDRPRVDEPRRGREPRERRDRGGEPRTARRCAAQHQLERRVEARQPAQPRPHHRQPAAALRRARPERREPDAGRRTGRGERPRRRLRVPDQPVRRRRRQEGRRILHAALGRAADRRAARACRGDAHLRPDRGVGRDADLRRAVRGRAGRRRAQPRAARAGAQPRHARHRQAEPAAARPALRPLRGWRRDRGAAAAGRERPAATPTTG